MILIANDSFDFSIPHVLSVVVSLNELTCLCRTLLNSRGNSGILVISAINENILVEKPVPFYEYYLEQLSISTFGFNIKKQKTHNFLKRVNYQLITVLVFTLF